MIPLSFVTTGYRRISIRYFHGGIASLLLICCYVSTHLKSVLAAELVSSNYQFGDLRLSYLPPKNDGGEEVTKYKIEWDASDNKAIVPSFNPSSKYYGSAEVARVNEEQDIIVSCLSACTGTFALSWGGRIADTPLRVDATSSEVEDVIGKLVGAFADTYVPASTSPVRVSRKANGFAFKWRVSFWGIRGDLGLIEADGNLLSGGGAFVRTYEVKPGVSDLYPGAYTNEIQTVTVRKRPGFGCEMLAGSFGLLFEGKETIPIKVDATSHEFKEALESLPTIHSVDVRTDHHISTGLGDCATKSWVVTFTHLVHENRPGAGNIGVLQPATLSLADPTVTSVSIFENVKGTNPRAFNIRGLTYGLEYHCRVSAYNSVGYGASSSTVTAIPAVQPRPPLAVLLSVPSGEDDPENAGTSIIASWGAVDDYDGGSAVTDYKVEWFTSRNNMEVQKVTTSSSDGTTEVQAIKISADKDGVTGFFTLTFNGETTELIAHDANADGEDSVEMKLERLSTVGNIEVTRGLSWTSVPNVEFNFSSGSAIISRVGGSYSGNLLGVFSVGDVILVGSEVHSIASVESTLLNLDQTYNGPSANAVCVYKWTYGYEWLVTFASHIGKQPLLKARPANNWAGTNAIIGVHRVREGLRPLSGSFRLGFEGERSLQIPFDAEAEQVKNALESLKSIGEVAVSRFNNNNGYNYFITFISELGDREQITVDDSMLMGPNAQARAGTIIDGDEPSNYGYSLLPHMKSTRMSTMKYQIVGLINGISYFVRIRCKNSKGFGYSTVASPFPMKTVKAPLPPSSVVVFPLSDARIRIKWKAPAHNGGSDVVKYSVQWDANDSFSSAWQEGFHYDILADIDNIEREYCHTFSVESSSLGTPRYARVLAFNGHEWSTPQTSSPQFTVGTVGTPGPVTDLNVFITSSIGIMVTWSHPKINDAESCGYSGDGGAPISHYVIEYSRSSEFSPIASSVVVSSTSTEKRLGGRDVLSGSESSDLEEGGIYFVRIMAFNSMGQGVIETFPFPIGPLADVLPGPPLVMGATSVSATSIQVEWNTPAYDGGDAIQEYVLEYDTNPDFAYASTVSVPTVNEVQAFEVGPKESGINVHSIQAVALVKNEVQSVITEIDGVDEVQEIATTCDDVTAEVQTIVTTAIDTDEEQTVSLIADDIDEIQLLRIQGDDQFEVQTVQVSVPRVNEVQRFGIIVSNINTDGDGVYSTACRGIDAGNPCPDVENALAGSFTVSFDFDECGTGIDGSANYCQLALSKYEMGTVICNPELVSNPSLGGDHCVSEPVTHYHSSLEGDAGTLQHVINNLVDDNGVAFMTSSNVPGKQTGVSVIREGRIKTKGSCTLDPVGINPATCSGEYELFYEITFDAAHVSGDVPPLTIVDSNFRLDETSSSYTNILCPFDHFIYGCEAPVGGALDSGHGSFYDGEIGSKGYEAVKGSQPIGTISLNYECESEVHALPEGYLMTVSGDGMSASFNYLGFVATAVINQWVRFSGGDGIDHYRKISEIDRDTESVTFFSRAPVNGATYSDVEYGTYFSDWDESDGDSGVSNHCKAFRVQSTLPIDVDVFNNAVSETDWRGKIGALQVIDSSGVTVSRSLLSDLSTDVGLIWDVTFKKQPGNVHEMSCDVLSGNSECIVSTLQDSSIIDGAFKLQTMWPHEYVSETIDLYETGHFHWNADQDLLKQGMEAITDSNGDRVFGLVQVSRSPYLSPSHSRWCGGYLWIITFLSRGGNIPALGFDDTGLFGLNPIIEISDEDSGVNDLFQGNRNRVTFHSDDPGLARDGNQIAGSFSLSWAGNSYHSSVVTGNVFTVQNEGSDSDRYTALSAEKFKTLFEDFVLLGSENQVDVIRSDQPTQWIGYSYTIKFRHQDLGGDVSPLNFISGSSLFGLNSRVQIEEQVKGTEITGTFQLRFEGETTRPINHDATAQDIEYALNELISIAPSTVIVSGGDESTRSGPPDGIEGLSTQVSGRVWYVTFASNIWRDPTVVHDSSFVPGNWVGPPASYSDTWSSGFSKAWGKNVGDVPLISCVQSGLSTTNGDIPDYGCSVRELIAGTNPLGGSFKLCLDTSISPNGVISVEKDACTGFIAHNAVASVNESGGDGSSVEEKLEELDNVGDVSVVRSEVNPRNGGYTWKIKFLTDADGPCQQKDDVHSMCNAPGDVPKICDAGGATTCDTDSLKGTCLKPGACSKLNVLDALDFPNGIHFPGGNEKQVVYVKDTSYLGWEDGSVINKQSILKEYKLFVNGIATQCIYHNALASEMASSIQAVLDSGIGGSVRVDRTRSEYLAQNGFLYHITFYDTGDLDTIQASFSDGACPHDFEFGQSIVVTPVSDGYFHQSNCNDCKDGVVQRGEIEKFEVPGDNLGGSLRWNAEASDVKMHLEQIYERTVAVTRNVLDKYGTIEWVVTFTQNAGVVPPGSGDIQELSVFQGRDTLGRPARVHVNERIKGSVGLSGTFDLDYLASGGSRTFAFDETAARMSRKLEEMSTIGRVRVTRECYPSCSSGGWGGIAVGPNTFGGYRWIIRFLKNPGSYNGFAFPYGSGVVNLPAVEFTRLVGDGATITTSLLSDGPLPLDGSFRLQVNGEVTSFVPYNVDSHSLKNAIDDLQTVGKVTVESGMQAKHLVQGVYASVETDGTSATLSGEDLRNHIAPGDFFSIGGSIEEIDGANHVGTASLFPLSPILSDVSLLGRNHLFAGESVRIAGDSYSIVKTGVEVQQLVVHRMNGIADANFYQLKVTFDGAVEVTKCLRFDASAVEVGTELNDLSILSNNGGVLVSGKDSSTGYAGDAHFFKIYFIGEGLVGDIEQLAAEHCSDGVPPGVDSTNSHLHVRSLSQGGKTEHQRITLASDYGSTRNIPAFRLSISDSELNSWDSPCFEWGVQSLDIAEKIDPFSFSQAILLVGGGGPINLGDNQYKFNADNFVEGFLGVGDLVNPGKKCPGNVSSIGHDGRSFVIVASAGCSAVVGDGIFVGEDVSVIDTFVDNRKSVSEVSELTVFSDDQVISEGGLYKIRVEFNGSNESTSCLPFDASAEEIRHAIGSLFDFNDDGVINSLDDEHISVTRKGDGTSEWGYGYSYEILSNGSNDSIGSSVALGSSAPKISILDIGADAGCVDAGIEGPLISSLASTTDESNVLLLGPDFSGKLKAGDRIRAGSSLVPSKVYTVDYIGNAGSIILTEDFSGATTIESAVVHAIYGGSPRFRTSIIRHGVDEFVYDIFFVGSHWKNVPQIEVNSFGDGTCTASSTDIIDGMNRKIEVVTLVDGGGSIASAFDDRYVLDRPAKLSHRDSYRLFVIPPIFSIADDSSEVQTILVMDSGNDSIWSSGNPSYKLSFGGEFTDCLPHDASERLLEDSLNSLESLCPGIDPCVTVTRRDDPALAPNGFVYTVYFDLSTTARHDIADPGFGGLEADISSLDCHPFDDIGGERVWIETIKQGRESLEFNSNKLPLGTHPVSRWVGEHQENLPIYRMSGFYWFVRYGQSLGNVPGLTIIPDDVFSETSYSAVDEIIRGLNPNQFTIGGIQTGIPHFFRVYSRSGIGFSASSNPVSSIPSGKPEKITTLSTGNAIHQNEVQNLVIAASHQTEVQSIQTSAMPIPEVQEVSLLINGIVDVDDYFFSLRQPEIQIVKWSAGSPVTSGSYFLKLRFVDRVNSDISGAVIYKEMKTPCINFDATADDVKRAIEIDSVSNGLGEDAVHVIRSGNRSYSSDFGYSYEIHFVGPSLRGNVLELISDTDLTGLDSNGGFTCDAFVSSTNDEFLEIRTENSSPAFGTDTPRAEIIINSNRDIVDGEFQVSVTYFGQQSTTECIPWDASFEQMKSALENLDNVDSVHDERTGNGHLSIENGSHVRLHEYRFQFLGGNSFLAIPPDNLSSAVYVGDMVQFSEQPDFSEFYEVTDVAGGTIEINKSFDAELFSNHVLTRFFGYRHIVYFNGNAMHTDGSDATGFKPEQGSNFIISETGNCRPLRAYENNVLKQMSDIPGAIASIRAVSKYDGGHTLPGAPSYSSSMVISKSLLLALPMSIAEAHVTQSLETTENELVFTITYGQNDGDVPSLVCNHSIQSASSTICTAKTVMDGNEIRGSFYIESSGPIPHDASPSVLEAAIEGVHGFGDVEVSRSDGDGQNGFIWLVTFVEYRGDIDPLQASSSLTGKAATISVNEVTKGNELRGHFSLSFGSMATDLIPYNTSAENLQATLENLGVIGRVNVYMDPHIDMEGGRAFSITFLDPDVGDVPLLVADTTYLKGSGASIYVSEEIKGSKSSRDALYISFDLPSGCSYSPVENGVCGAPVTEVAVEVSTSENFIGMPISYQYHPDVSTQIIRTFCPGIAPPCQLTGYFNIEYGGHLTSPISSNASEVDVRIALERLPGINTVGVTKKHGFRTVSGACIDVVAGSYSVTCSPSCSPCNFGSKGIAAGAIIELESKRFRVSSTYDAVQEEFDLSMVADSSVKEAYVGDNDLVEWNLLVWTGGYEWIVALHSTIETAARLTAPKHHLFPSNAAVEISTRDCNKCMYLSSLNSGTQYYIRARTKNVRGWSEYSDVVSHVPMGIPSAPTNIRLNAISGDCLEVVFDPPHYGEPFKSYVIQWDYSESFDSAEGVSASCNSGRYGNCVLSQFSRPPPYTYEICNLHSSESYHVRVAARNAVRTQSIHPDGSPKDNTNWSTIVSKMTSDQVPDPPTALDIKVLGRTGAQILFDWPKRNGGSEISRFLVHYDTSEDFSSAIELIFESTQPEKIAESGGKYIFDFAPTDPPLIPGSRYFLKMSAINTVGTGAFSKMKSFVPSGPPDPPIFRSLSTLEFSKSPITEATVSWMPPASTGGNPIDGYFVEWWTSGKSPEVQAVRLLYTSPLSATTFTLSFSPNPTIKKETSNLPWNAPPDLVRRELLNLGWDESRDSLLLSDVKVMRSTLANGYLWTITFGDNPDRQLNDGDQVRLVGSVTSNGDLGTPLITVSTVRDGQRPQGLIEIQYLQIIGTGTLSGFYRIKFLGSEWTNYIPVHADAAYVKQALEQLTTIGDVHVVQNDSLDPIFTGTGPNVVHHFEVHFVGNPGNVESMVVDSYHVSSTNHDATVLVYDGNNALDTFNIKDSAAVPGELPLHYGKSELLDSNSRTYQISGLITGIEYFVAVSARNSKHGVSKRAYPSPASIVPAVQEPGTPQNVRLAVNSGYSDSLVAHFDPPESTGGDAILLYRVELDPSPSFDNPIVQDIECPPSNRRTEWEIITYVEGDGVINGGSFRLELEVDGFISVTSDIPYDAVALSSNETGVTQFLSPTFSTLSSSDILSTIPPTNIENVIFPGDRLRFSGQTESIEYYEVISVTSISATLNKPFDGNDGAQASTTRHYGGRGSPLSSRVHCNFNEDLCPKSSESRSGSMQSKIEDLSLAVKKGVLVDRDGPNPDNGFIWRVTFLDNAYPDGSNFSLRVHTNTLTIFGGQGAPQVSTRLMTAGKTFSSCFGSVVVPSFGGLVKGLEYYGRVSARNSEGYSLPMQATMPLAPMVIPGAPTGVALDVVSATELRVIFGSPSDNGGDSITQYLIEWSTTREFMHAESTTLDYLVGGSPFFKIISGLQTGIYYYVRVSAKNSQGYGISQVATPASMNPHQRPSPPTSVKLGITSSTMLTIGWDAPISDGGDSISKYRIEWDTRQEFTSSSHPPNRGYIDVAASFRSHTLQLLSSEKSYFLRIHAVNSAGSSTPQLTNPGRAVPSLQMPGVPYAVVASPGTVIGTVEVSWQRPRVPHHGIPCFEEEGNISECPTPYGGSIPASDGGDDIIEYEIEINNRPDFLGSDGLRKTYAGYHAIINDLYPQRIYFVRVLARNSVGSGKYSNFVQVTAT